MSSAYRRPTLGGIVKVASSMVVVGALVWYAAFQARGLIIGPTLALADTAVTHDTRIVILTGTARNITALTLNDRPIFTDDHGTFREQLVLENGYTIMTLRAKDRYGREEVLVQPFVYTPAYESFWHD